MSHHRVRRANSQKKKVRRAHGRASGEMIRRCSLVNYQFGASLIAILHRPAQYTIDVLVFVSTRNVFCRHASFAGAASTSLLWILLRHGSIDPIDNEEGSRFSVFVMDRRLLNGINYCFRSVCENHLDSYQTIAVQAPSYQQQSIYRTGQAHTRAHCIHVRITYMSINFVNYLSVMNPGPTRRASV